MVGLSFPSDFPDFTGCNRRRVIHLSRARRTRFLVSPDSGFSFHPPLPDRSCPTMSKKMAGVLAAYGVVLSVLGFLATQQPPPPTRLTFFTGAAGGGLCILWSGIALAGNKHRSRIVLTLAAVAFVMLHQFVQAWFGSAEAQSSGLGTRVIPTLMLVATVAMLMYVLHGERPPEFYKSGRAGTSPSSSAKTQSSAGGTRQ
jgi:peptidoglycan/LPS O-acetylase OafA/YrhL